MSDKKSYIWQLEKPGETNYYVPATEKPYTQTMIWTGRVWLHWGGENEGTAAVKRNEAQDWLRAHGHLEMPTREELAKEHEGKQARFKGVLRLAVKRFEAGIITREEVISSLITEVEQ